MPVLDGIEATKRIAADHPGTAVLVLTSFSDRPRILGALESGVCGYLLKDVAAEEVAAGIRAAARGESSLDPRAAKAMLGALAGPDPLAGLSQREREVLALLAESLPNKLIARRLTISEKTVKSLSRASSARSTSPTAPRPRCGPSGMGWGCRLRSEGETSTLTRWSIGCPTRRSRSTLADQGGHPVRP